MRTWSRPRVKPEHTPSRLTDGRVHIGGTTFGVASEILDPTGSVWDLLAGLDGSRAGGEIIELVRRDHPELTGDDIAGMVDDLAAAGHLDDAGEIDPPELSERERVRYGRGRLLWRWMDPTPRVSSWDVQLALKDASVLVIGVGGTGGAAATSLVASGVGRIHLVDPDRVELSNLNRQTLFTEADIGRRKVDAALDRLRALNSDVEITAGDDRVDGIDEIAKLAAGRDVVSLCADEPGEIRNWTNAAALRAGFPWVDAGYHGPRVSVGVFVPWSGACYECVWEYGRTKMAELGHVLTDRPRRSLPGVTATSAALSGQLAAHAVMSLITGVPEPRPGRIDMVNLVRFDGNESIVPDPDPACTACGRPADRP